MSPSPLSIVKDVIELRMEAQVMKREESDHKAIAKMDKIQQKYGGRKPEYIVMLFADRLNCLTKVLLALSIILAVLAGLQLYVLLG
jgi:hypothetical protein